MTYRTGQFNNDEDLSLNNQRLTSIQSLLFSTLAAGTVPVANEVLYADGRHQLQQAWVRTRLVIGDTNRAIIQERAATIPTDTRTRVPYYDGNGRLYKVEEKDGATVVKTTTYTLDALGRVSAETIEADGKTTTTSLSYSSNTEKVASNTRTSM